MAGAAVETPTTQRQAAAVIAIAHFYTVGSTAVSAALL
jgi:hypothetical protein